MSSLTILIVWLVILYTGLLIAGVLLTTIAYLVTCKYFADEGFKINDMADDPETETIACEFNMMTEKIKWFPLLNLLNPLFLLTHIMFDNKEELIDKCYKSLQIVSMSKKELDRYKKQPNIFTATSINNKSSVGRKDLYIKYFENGASNTIYFDIIGDNYIITKVDGPDANLSNMEIKNILIESLCSYAKKNINPTKCFLDYNNNDDEVKSIDGCVDDKITKKLSIEEQKSLLLQYKNFILNIKEEERDDKYDKISVFVKKKK
jgi:hypothetical protein